MKVTIWHDVERDFQDRPLGMLDGYSPGHKVVAVFRYDEPDGTDPHEVANRAYHLFNVGDDPDYGVPDVRAVAYRAAENRSLSKGDIVQVDELWLACARSGWDRVEPPADALRVSTTHYGTTPLSA